MRISITGTDSTLLRRLDRRKPINAAASGTCTHVVRRNGATRVITAGMKLGLCRLLNAWEVVRTYGRGHGKQA
jgi:hypothetical protein